MVLYACAGIGACPHNAAWDEKSPVLGACAVLTNGQDTPA